MTRTWRAEATYAVYLICATPVTTIDERGAGVTTIQHSVADNNTHTYMHYLCAKIDTGGSQMEKPDRRVRVSPPYLSTISRGNRHHIGDSRATHTTVM